jgi:plastocyanin
MRTKGTIAGVAVVALTVVAGLQGCSKKEGPVSPPGGSNSFDSGTLVPGASFSKVFPNATSTPVGYHCGFHSNMTGTVTVASGQADSSLVTIVDSTNDGFSPKNVSVRPGGTVRWINAHNLNHTATSH